VAACLSSVKGSEIGKHASFSSVLPKNAWLISTTWQTHEKTHGKKTNSVKTNKKTLGKLSVKHTAKR
jgi:hypothetical protein